MSASILAARSPAMRAAPAADLFLVSFGLLFLELACIRWMPAHLRMLAFFSNFVLLACFLGMSLGLIRSQRPWLFPWTLPMLAGVAAIPWGLDLGIRLESAGAAGSIYFGAEYLEQAGMNLPFWQVLIPAFVVIAALFVGPGQAIARLFDELPPLAGYSVNVAGSVAGILAFMAVSALSLGPPWWFAIAGAAFLIPLRRQVRHLLISAAALAAVVLLVAPLERGVTWSPYNRITFQHTMEQGQQRLTLFVNSIAHQHLLPFGAPGTAFYELPYQLHASSTGKEELGRVLIIGAGTGNDVSRALKHGAAAVDAVDIDPRIQAFGVLHPEKPYADPRVRAVVDDGRSFLRKSGDAYDWIVYAYVDSLTLLSQFGAIRLENYLFTEEAFRDVKDHLAPGGVFAAYNYYRESWLAVRIYRLLQKVFGAEHVLMITFPPREEIRAGEGSTDLVLFLAGDVAPIRQKLAAGRFFLHAGSGQEPLVDVRRIEGFDELVLPTDDWPFPYVARRSVPLHNLEGVGLVLGLALLLVFGVGRVRPGSLSLHFLCLGAAFMLVETRAIARLALLFGSTWISNSLTFLGILVAILLANALVTRLGRVPTGALYGLLFAAIALDFALPWHVLLGLPPAWRAGTACLVLFLPILMAGMIFARSFRSSRNPGQDLGANVLGAMLGGCLENLSVVIGFRWLILAGAVLYALSWVALRRDPPEA